MPKAWSDAAGAVAVGRDRRVGDGPVASTLQLYVAGFAASATEVAGYFRGQGGIKTAGRAGQNPARTRRIGLSPLKAGPSTQSIKNKILRCGWDSGFLERALRGEAKVVR